MRRLDGSERLGVVARKESKDLRLGLAYAVAEQRVDGVVISSGVFFARYRDRLITLAARYAIPTIATERDYPSAGGLMSYGSDIGDAYRQAPTAAASILRRGPPCGQGRGYGLRTPSGISR